MTLHRNAPGDGQKPRIKLWGPRPRPIGLDTRETSAELSLRFRGRGPSGREESRTEISADLTDLGRQRAALDYGFGSVMPDVLKGRLLALLKASQEARPNAPSCKSRNPIRRTWLRRCVGRNCARRCARWTMRPATSF